MDKVNINSFVEAKIVPPKSKIVILDSLHRKFAIEASSNKQMLIEGFMFALVLQGEARVILDDVEYQLHQGDLFGCNPHNMLEHSMISLDSRFLGFFVTPEYVSELLSTITVDWSFLMMPSTHEVLHAEDDEIERLVAYTNLLRQKLEAPDTPHKDQSISALIQSMGLEIFDIHARQVTCCHQTDFSHGENLVQRFVVLLQEARQQGKPYLNVNGYAELLNVTPKYFSVVCKNITGKTAKELINEAIMLSAKTLLHDNSLSIKQISQRLGFANQSHFGSFFRRHSGGKSPMEVRAKGN